MKKSSKKHSQWKFKSFLTLLKKHKIVATGAIVLLLVGAVLIFKESRPDEVNPTASNGNEIELIKSIRDTDKQAEYYLALIERVGPVEAQEQLMRSGLPFTGETHLINHTVGMYIYEKYGIEGIVHCRDYFLGSCYHGLLMNVIQGSAEKDKASIEKIIKFCKEAPPGALTQCIHGVGHGYVPALGYKNLFVALEQCDKLGKSVPGFLAYNCFDGAFMENVWGVHSGKPSPDRLVKADDPLYPCNDPRMIPEYLNACWSNQPSLLYQNYQGDLAKVSAICLQVEPSDAKESCFNGLSRQIHPLTENKTEKVFELCDKLDNNWHEYCYMTIVNAAFSVGDRFMPFEVCDRLQTATKQKCNDELIYSIRYFAATKEQSKEWCGLIKDIENLERTRCLQESEFRQ